MCYLVWDEKGYLYQWRIVVSSLESGLTRLPFIFWVIGFRGLCIRGIRLIWPFGTITYSIESWVFGCTMMGCSNVLGVINMYTEIDLTDECPPATLRIYLHAPIGSLEEREPLESWMNVRKECMKSSDKASCWRGEGLEGSKNKYIYPSCEEIKRRESSLSIIILVDNIIIEIDHLNSIGLLLKHEMSKQ